MSCEPDLIYDVGMHRGEDTAFYLAKGFRVVAFEANPDLVEENASRFSEALANERLHIVEGAIVADPSVGKISFYKNLDNTVWGTVDPDWAARNEKLGARNEEIRVDAIDFVACLETHGVPHYLKIDIEGADRVCLESLLRVDTKPSYVSVESEKVDFERLVGEIDLLERIGYREFVAVQQEDMPRTRIPDPPREGERVEHHFPKGSSGLFGRELAGPWKSRSEIMEEYERIFRGYRKYGDATGWQRFYPARVLLRLVAIALRRPIPGWYDTHARLGDAEP